jgi:hypothetical protein
MDQSVFVGKSTPSHGRDLVLAMWWGWQAWLRIWCEDLILMACTPWVGAINWNHIN